MLKIVVKPGQNVYITSDTHAYHKNICRGVSNWRVLYPATGEISVPIDSTRDFKNIYQMTDTIAFLLNSRVLEDDILIHLGDFSFGGFENIQRFREKIVCKNLHLITGNHDHHIVNNRDGVRSLFSSVHEYYTQLEIKWPETELGYKKASETKHTVILSHFPIASWDGLNKGRIHLFGHCHLPSDKKIMEGRAMDVGVDGNDYEPYRLRQVLESLSVRPIKHLRLPKDHHETEHIIVND